MPHVVFFVFFKYTYLFIQDPKNIYTLSKLENKFLIMLIISELRIKRYVSLAKRFIFVHKLLYLSNQGKKYYIAEIKEIKSTLLKYISF